MQNVDIENGSRCARLAVLRNAHACIHCIDKSLYLGCLVQIVVFFNEKMQWIVDKLMRKCLVHGASEGQ